MTVKEALLEKTRLQYILAMGVKSSVIKEKSDQQAALEAAIKMIDELMELAVLPESGDLQTLLDSTADIKEQISEKVNLAQIWA